MSQSREIETVSVLINGVRMLLNKHFLKFFACVLSGHRPGGDTLSICVFEENYSSLLCGS